MPLMRIIDIDGKIRWAEPSQLTSIGTAQSTGPLTSWTLVLNFGDQRVRVKWDTYVRFQKQLHPTQNTRQAEQFDFAMFRQANQLMLEQRYRHASDFVHQVLKVITPAQLRLHCWPKIDSHVRHYAELVTAAVHLEDDIRQALPDDTRLVVPVNAQPGLLGNVLEAYLVGESLSKRDEQRFAKEYLQRR